MCSVPGNPPTMTPVSQGTTAAVSYSTAAARAAATGGHCTQTGGTGRQRAVTVQPRKDHKQGHGKSESVRVCYGGHACK